MNDDTNTNQTKTNNGEETESGNNIAENDIKLIQFQEITQENDLDECKVFLESTGWDLNLAVQSYFNRDIIIEQDIEPPTSNNVEYVSSVAQNNIFNYESINSQPNFNHLSSQISQNIFNPSIPTRITDTETDFSSNMYFNPISSQFDSYFNKAKRLLKFNIEYLGKKFTFHIPDDEKVKKIKELIEEKIQVEVKNQKLTGWKNKDLFINDETFLRDINLPLENNLSVINQALFVDDSVTISNTTPNTSASFSTQNDSYELVIKIIKINNQFSNISKKIHNDSDNESDANKNETNSFYRLHFSSETKFIEIRRRLALLTNIFTNNQEWWYYIINNDLDLLEKEVEEIKRCNNMKTFHKLIESEKLFSLPLTSIIEDNLSLLEIKKSLDDLIDPNNECVKKSSKITTSASISTSNDNSKLTSNSSETSKLTNTNIKNNQLNVKSNSNKMFFIITLRSPIESTNIQRESLDSISISDHQSGNDQSSKKVKISQINIGENCFNEANNQNSEDDFNVDNDDDMHNIEEEELDEHFIVNSNKKQQALISKDCPVGDEISCTNSIVQEFTNRYGPMVPLFFVGSLEEAIKEALLCPAKDRKLLGIYLHSDQTVFCNIFCSKTLCDENIINFISSNFVVWPWDITNKEHEEYFYETCSKYLGSVFLSNLRGNKEKFPVFLIVTRVRSNNEVAAIIEGDTTNDSMMNRLMQAYEMFESQRSKDELDEKTRDERERIKREQDAAYQASLEFDKAKRQRQTEEDEKLKLEALRDIEIQNKKVQEINNRKRNALESLNDEPSDDVPNSKITKIRFRLPDGNTLQRKFFITEKLDSIINYATSHGYFTDEYKILSTWPRRDLTNLSNELTIEELKLYPQETLTFEQR